MAGEWRIWILAGLLSAIVHSLFFYREVPVSVREGQAQEPTTLRVSFQAAAAPVAAARVSGSESAVTEQARPSLAERPAQKQTATGKSAKAVEPEAAEKPSLERKTAEVPTAAEDSEPIGEMAVAAEQSAASEAKARQEYLALLMKHIERQKFYPKSARRRGLEGKIGISFLIAEGTIIAALECSGGANVLRDAACEAVRSAEPLPVPPPSISLPVPIVFQMEYKLH